ncbi:MAG: hypothetical protein HYS27_21560 [Deltaproteobacteria bacterium]|nr:hypothetical protein [Deltaproteobacteria bacterium]
MPRRFALALTMVATAPLLLGEDECLDRSDPDSEECREAKQHVCDGIEGQACSLATMGPAMDDVRTACGNGAADAFAPAVEQACEDNALGECTSL